MLINFDHLLIYKIVKEQYYVIENKSGACRGV